MLLILHIGWHTLKHLSSFPVGISVNLPKLHFEGLSENRNMIPRSVSIKGNSLKELEVPQKQNPDTNYGTLTFEKESRKRFKMEKAATQRDPPDYTQSETKLLRNS